MATGATLIEIRAAYRERARRLHPDTGGEAGQADAAEMAAVNEAWYVLRDPQRRRAYDRALALAEAPPEPHRETQSQSGTRMSRLVDDVAHAGASRLPFERVMRSLPWLLVMAVLGMIFVFTAFASSGSRNDPADGLVQQGSCVVLRAGFPATEVPCGGAHDGVVRSMRSFDVPCPPGTESWNEPTGLRRACVQRAAR